MADAESKAQELERAKELERGKRVDEAAMAYMQAGDPAEASRVLIEARRFADAARLLLKLLEIPPRDVTSLDASGRRLAFRAALCAWRGGDRARSIELLIGLGDFVRAEQLLEEAGDENGVNRVRLLSRQAAAARTSIFPRPHRATPRPATPVPEHEGPVRDAPPTLVANASPPPTAHASPPRASHLPELPANRASLAPPVAVVIPRDPVPAPSFDFHVQVEDSRENALALERAGNHAAAYPVYLRLDEPFHAARMLSHMGRHSEAGALLEQRGMPFESACAHHTGGDLRKALDALLRVPLGSPHYPRSCIHAIKLATKLADVGEPLAAFLEPLIARGPKDVAEADALYVAAGAFGARGMTAHARAAYEAIVRVSPDHRDTRTRLVAFDAEMETAQLPAEAVARLASVRAAALAGKPQKTEPPPVLADPPPAVTLVGRMLNDLRATLVDAEGSAPPKVVDAPVAFEAAPMIRTGGEVDRGDVVAGRYRIEGLLGRGGMATVHEARDLELDDLVAIKIFTSLVDDPQYVGRFKQEVMLSRKLNHPNVVRLYDFGAHGGVKFITMELLEGTELTALLGVPMGLRRGLSYLIDACAGLAAVHGEGVVHRDLKPANFFITRTEGLKIMDFGIAKLQTRGTRLTGQGFSAGTPEYMSPEQIEDFARVGPLSDVYALGVIAYEIFTGSLPFQHPNVQRLLVMHLAQAPTPPSSICAAIPKDLEALILRLLEKEPSKRVQGCDELGAQLIALRDRLPA